MSTLNDAKLPSLKDKLLAQEALAKEKLEIIEEKEIVEEVVKIKRGRKPKIKVEVGN